MRQRKIGRLGSGQGHKLETGWQELGKSAATGLVQEGHKAWALCGIDRLTVQDGLGMWSVRQTSGGSQQAVCDLEENCHGTGSQW